MGQGIGYIDAQLLTAVALSNARLWTHDKHLQDVASEFGMTYTPPPPYQEARPSRKVEHGIDAASTPSSATTR